MKKIVALVLQITNAQVLAVCVVSMFFLAGCIHAQTVNLSTKEAVIEQLGRQKDEKFSKDAVCIERLKESAKIIVIGFFRHDYGCAFDGAFVNSIYVGKNENLSKKALAALGWKRAKREARERLAMVWSEKGLLAFSTVLYKKDEGLDADDFQPPQVITNENGETVVRLWISFVRRRKEFQLVELKFAKDGSLSGNSTLKTFSKK